jgi:2-methylaconitate cis-trans-isomerase PrpF
MSPSDPVRIAQPSGLTVVGAAVRRNGEKWFAESATVYRTARRLMEGWVFVRASALPENLRSTLAADQE